MANSAQQVTTPTFLDAINPPGAAGIAWWRLHVFVPVVNTTPPDQGPLPDDFYDDMPELEPVWPDEEDVSYGRGPRA